MSELEKTLKDAKDKEELGDFFTASILYKESAKLAQKAGDSESIKLCKKKIVETNKKAVNDFKEISTDEIKIPNAVIDKVIDSIIGVDLKTTLKNIGVHSELYIKHKHLEGGLNVTPVSALFANHSTISTDGHLIRGGWNGPSVWYFKSYSINQGIISGIYLEKIFKKIMKEQELNKDTLLSYFKETGLFTDKSLEIIIVGLERYFEKDYISAIHILIPQFESFFLHVSDMLGIDTISIVANKEVSTQTKTLSSTHLQSEQFKKIWGEDFCNQIDFILFEPMGYKLRHKVAHGEISNSECSFEMNTLVIQLLLAVSARIEVKKE